MDGKGRCANGQKRSQEWLRYRTGGAVGPGRV